jgi:hypothetical protein
VEQPVAFREIIATTKQRTHGNDLQPEVFDDMLIPLFKINFPRDWLGAKRQQSNKVNPWAV